MVLRRRTAPLAPRPFYLLRTHDVSGVSGTGVVAVGVVMPSGRAVLEWCSRWPTLTVFASVEEILRIHGHGGHTRLTWGAPPEPSPTARASTPARRIGHAWWHRVQQRLHRPRVGRAPEPEAPMPWPGSSTRVR